MGPKNTLEQATGENESPTMVSAGLPNQTQFEALELF
jgi:hypothetical protein